MLNEELVNQVQALSPEDFLDLVANHSGLVNQIAIAKFVQPSFMELISNQSEELQLAFIKAHFGLYRILGLTNPSEKVILFAVRESGGILPDTPEVSEKAQLLSVKLTEGHALQYIQQLRNPSVKAQMAAIRK